jgi:hypothetical protein
MHQGTLQELHGFQDVLRDDIIAAQVRLRRAIARFVEVVEAVSGSVPDSDQSLQITNAGAERRAALANLAELVRRRRSAELRH